MNADSLRLSDPYLTRPNPAPRGLLTKLALWRRRSAERAQLARLDARMRNDLGLSDADVWAETRKAAWHT